ncbi:hypothetical protein [Burkholderia cepacia]|nr:hypothetical protein [Burkholderia cepacia]
MRRNSILDEANNNVEPLLLADEPLRVVTRNWPNGELRART